MQIPSASPVSGAPRVPTAAPAEPATFAGHLDRANAAIGWSLFGYHDDDLRYGLGEVVDGAKLASTHLDAALEVGGPSAAAESASKGRELIARGVEVASKGEPRAIELFTAAAQSVWQAWRDSAVTAQG